MLHVIHELRIILIFLHRILIARFMISLEEGVELVWHAFEDMKGGEIYVKKIPSMKVTDVALAISSNVKQEEVGIRPGEKLHEQMIGSEDALYTYEYDRHFKILPSINNWSRDPARIGKGVKVDPGFTYCSDNNKEWMKRFPAYDKISEPHGLRDNEKRGLTCRELEQRGFWQTVAKDFKQFLKEIISS